jgi:hypothetical protein
MVLIAAIAVTMGWRQHRACEALRLEYEGEAFESGMMEGLCRKNGSISHEEWVERCREVARWNKEGPFEVSGGIRVVYCEPDPPDLERRRAEYFGRRKAKYERAALRPWLPLGRDEPYPSWSDSSR